MVGYEGIYSVSDLGNIMSMNYANTGMLKLLTPNKVKCGYWRVSLFKNRKQKTSYIHALVMAAFVGPRPNGMQINHKNADKKDNRLSNLEYCTAMQNKKHAVGLGLHAYGEKNGAAKLTQVHVEEIRRKLNSGMSGAAIGREYGVSKGAISMIKLNRTWSFRVQ